MTTAMKVRKVLIPATEQINSHTVCGRVCDHLRQGYFCLSIAQETCISCSAEAEMTCLCISWQKCLRSNQFDGKIFLSNVAIGIETSYSDTKSRFRHSKRIAGVFRKVYLRSSFYCKLKSFMPISFYVAIIRNNSSIYLLIQ